jgi:hypothetical protein
VCVCYTLNRIICNPNNKDAIQKTFQASFSNFFVIVAIIRKMLNTFRFEIKIYTKKEFLPKNVFILK